MAHEIEQFSDGSAAFVSARQDAWHRLGTVLDDTFSAEQAMEHAHLGGWNVRKAPLVAREGEQELEVPDKYATIRNHPETGDPDVLGTVGGWYEPIQNEAHCELLDTLVDEGGAHFETAGSLRGGREVFVTMKLPQHMEVGGVDPVDTYIAALNSHDGSSAFRLLVTPVRIVCANTQAAALSKSKARFDIRHTASAPSNLAQAREALGMTFKYMEDFQAQAERMINESLREVDFTNKIRRLFVMRQRRQGDLATKRHEDKIATLRSLFRESETNTEIRGTRWAGYQAVAEYLDHYAPVQAGKGADQFGITAQDTRAEKTLASRATHDLKLKAFEAFAVK